MILELDCGNSLIKWRIINKHDEIVVRGANQQLQQLFIDIDNSQQILGFCRVVSVRSEQETLALITHIKTHYSISIKRALSSKEALGVKNGYHDYNRLGADRWSAMIAAYHHSQKATLILSFGTAITSDFIDQHGQHLGGFITPGLLLMRQQLLSNTNRIYYDETIAKTILTSAKSPGKSTEDAVNGGCQMMIQGFISQQLQLASHYFGQHFNLYASGGDAKHFDIPEVTHMPDLVFNGLSLLCPITDNL